jgi:cytochrome P450
MFEMLLQDAGRPDFLFVDLRPVSQPMVIVASHEIAEQISRATKLYPTSVFKSPTVQSGFARLIGAYSIITEEGESWKGLRKRFNPGFAHSHLLSLLPTIIAKSTTFMGKLDVLAESKKEFELDPLCTNLTFDIIGDIVTNIDLKAQEPNTHTIVYHFKELSKTFSDTGRAWLWANVPLRIKRLYHSYCVDAAIKECIKEKFTEIKATQSIETKETRDRSVLALALKDIDVLTSESLQITADQVKSFFFAGHDTTSILLQWLFYALSIHPGCLKAIRDEHDTVFGDRNPGEVFLSKPDETVKSLSYTAACIKEALRLWPPAASARLSIPGKGFKVRLSDGQEVCLDGTILYQCHYLIQRDPKVYGDTVNDFMPERWLGDHDTASTNRDEEGSEMGMSKVPNSAWRPFERGPRNCIGQELANLVRNIHVVNLCTSDNH